MKRNLCIAGLVFLVIGCITVPDYTGMTPEQIEASQKAEAAARQARQMALNTAVDIAFVLLDEKLVAAELAGDIENLVADMAIYRLGVTGAVNLAVGFGLAELEVIEKWNDLNVQFDMRIDTILGVLQPEEND